MKISELTTVSTQKNNEIYFNWDGQECQMEKVKR